MLPQPRLIAHTSVLLFIEVLISTVLREIRDERDAPALCADVLRALETCGGACQAWNGARPSEQPRQAAFRTHPPPPQLPPIQLGQDARVGRHGDARGKLRRFSAPSRFLIDPSVPPVALPSRRATHIPPPVPHLARETRALPVRLVPTGPIRIFNLLPKRPQTRYLRAGARGLGVVLEDSALP